MRCFFLRTFYFKCKIFLTAKKLPIRERMDTVPQFSTIRASILRNRTSRVLDILIPKSNEWEL